MEAVVTLDNNKVVVKTKEIPSIAPDEILVKVVAVALNPADCMYFN